MKRIKKFLAAVLACALAVVMLVACAPNSNPEKAVSSLDKNGYAATKLTDAVSLTISEKLYGVERGDIEAVVTGTKTVDKDGSKKVESVTIVYFKSASVAKSAWDKVKSNAEKDGKDESDWTVKKSGAMVYYGTSAAIKAAK